MQVGMRQNTFTRFNSSRLLVAIAQSCKSAVPTQVIEGMCLVQKMFTQLDLHLFARRDDSVSTMQSIRYFASVH